MATIWSFDLGKASIGEAVRDTETNEFPHKASLLIPSEFAKRGPLDKPGTPASRYRAWVTRSHRRERERWLDVLWQAAELTPLQKRILSVEGGQWRCVTKADPRLEDEDMNGGGEDCRTSCVLRIALLGGGKLIAGGTMSDWQIYKALFSAVQKRGVGDVPWKERRPNDENADPKKVGGEAAENNAGSEKWQEFLRDPAVHQQPDTADPSVSFRRPCYYDAWRMKLWNPAEPAVVNCTPIERPKSTRGVAFPAEIIEREIADLARAAAKLLPQLNDGVRRWMLDYKAGILARVEKVNAHRRDHGRAEITAPALAGGAQDFAELLTYGPGGKPRLEKGVRAIASADPALRRDMGLKRGHPDDLKAAIGQIYARFENRLRSECALLGPCGPLKKGFSACRNTTADDLRNASGPDDEHLLPAQLVFLMKLKNLWIEELGEGKKQRKLHAKEIRDIYEERRKAHHYWLRPREWRLWCREKLKAEPVVVEQGKMEDDESGGADGEGEKKKGKFIVEPAATKGRSRYSRPALRLLRALILNDERLKPSEFARRLRDGDAKVLADAGVDVLAEPPMEERVDERGNKFRVFVKREGTSRPWVLAGQLGIFDRMRSEHEREESWENLFVPSRREDFELRGDSGTAEMRAAAIRKVIGANNNPIVRDRLETFWRRLRYLESEAQHDDREGFGIPQFIAIELVRDDLENSWLGAKAKDKIIESRDRNEATRKRARSQLADAKLPVTERNILRYQLWEAQGGECLYGKEVKKAGCIYLETGLPLTELESYRIDHIVPRALGGPDAFSNYVLTTDDTNAKKGDRTPWQWFRDHGFDGWVNYTGRVNDPVRARRLGFKKARLLVSAEAEKLVSRYTPLAETAWIARQAAVIANLHFGWINGVDEKRQQRVFTFSGGITGRTRRRYFLNSLTGEHRADVLPDDDTARSDRERNAEIELADKNRQDHRHHALDAMVLNLLVEHPEVRDPKREEEFRFESLGDNPCFLPAKRPAEQMLRRQIASCEEEYKALRARAAARHDKGERASLAEQMDKLQATITKHRDAIGKLWQKRNWRPVRELFRCEIQGDEARKIQPILPRWLHYPKTQLEATFHRGVWVRVEDEKKADVATIENYDQAFHVMQQAVALIDFAYIRDPRTRQLRYCHRHAARMVQAIAPHPKDYDAHIARGTVQQFLKTKPDEAQWRAWCESPSAPCGVKAKKGEPTVARFKIYKIEERRTKAVPLASLPLPGTDDDKIEEGPSKKPKALVDDYQRDVFLERLNDLVIPPPRITGKKSKSVAPSPSEQAGELRPNIELQQKLRSLEPSIAAFYQEHSPNHGKAPRKGSNERQVWESNRRAFFKSEAEFFAQHGIDFGRRFPVKNPTDSEQEKPWKVEKLRRLVLVQVPAYSRVTAFKKIKGLTDPWTRFQLRQFLRTQPELAEWRAFCAVFTQAGRSEFSECLTRGASSPAEFIAFYDQLRRDNIARSVITHVHKRIGSPEEYVDVSKDGSGIFAKGGNRGYLMFRREKKNDSGEEEIVFGTRAVRGHQRLNEMRRELCNEPGVTLYDTELWRTNMLLHLPRDLQSGKKTLVSGYYYFASISNEASMTLKPLAGGDQPTGIMVNHVLKAGLRRVD